MGPSYRIAEAARRTGFSPTTLRYYEDAGVLPPPHRTPGGYRVYDDRALERLRFVARLKQLDCTLDEITALVAAWEADECAPVQDRLRAVVDAKAAGLRRRMEDELARATELRAASASLAGQPPAGRCGDGCGCAAAPARDVAVACSLEADRIGDRVAEWQAALAPVVARRPLPDGLRLELAPGAALGELARLVAAEQACCPFFSFALTVDARGAALEVTAPPEGRSVLDALFG